MQDVEAIAVRLRDARSLPELLAVSFDAFEAIRVLARGSEDLTPRVFAAFMTLLTLRSTAGKPSLCPFAVPGTRRHAGSPAPCRRYRHHR